MRPRLKTIRYNGDHRLAFAYEDGLAAELDFSAYLTGRSGPMIAPLGEERFFAQAFIDHGVLTWPNGYDVCPDILRAWCEAGRILSREETDGRVAQSLPSPAATG
ncbi:MAG: DUF2442 domain-containing protein [Verrucomicrobia bacterium]|nr:DUF2442 domain-containing protein [Verrucomicrobiota bacterium]